MEAETDFEGDRVTLSARLDTHLATAAGLRAQARANPQRARARDNLRRWQADRLEQTYPDLLESPRYGPAARFFLSDLYGPVDFAERDAEVARILPMVERMLPRAGLLAIDHALELDALSETMDAAMIDALWPAISKRPPSAASYARAWRSVGQRPVRQRQVDLVEATGAALELLAGKPLVQTALRLMHGPAKLAGLEDLHAFLTRGFNAFHHMAGAEEFLETVISRERAFIARQFAPD